MTNKFCDTLYAKIYIAGRKGWVERLCSRWCKENTLCVSVKEVEFVYNGGQESGVEVMLLNYPKYPSKDADELIDLAVDLGDFLKDEMSQDSYLVMSKDVTLWTSDRPCPPPTSTQTP